MNRVFYIYMNCDYNFAALEVPEPHCVYCGHMAKLYEVSPLPDYRPIPNPTNLADKHIEECLINLQKAARLAKRHGGGLSEGDIALLISYWLQIKGALLG